MDGKCVGFLISVQFNFRQFALVKAFNCSFFPKNSAFRMIN
jgi:hypothetical protein